MEISELREREKALLEQLNELRSLHKQAEQPLIDALAELDKVWPKKQFVWYDLCTGVPARVEMRRIEE